MNCCSLIKTAVLLAICLTLGRPYATALAQSAGTADAAAQDEQDAAYAVALGDTWQALAGRFELPPSAILAANNTINPHRQPAVGSQITLPESKSQYGRFLRPLAGGSLQIAARNGRNPWSIALQNELPHPYSPLLYTPLILPGGSLPPREFPTGLDTLALFPGPFYPGSAFALRARAAGKSPPNFTLEGESLVVSGQPGDRFVALGATGAFFPPGQPLLTIRTADNPLWEQPLTIADRDWTWEQVTFNNAAVLDPEQLRLERERLQSLWDESDREALWRGQFLPAITDFVEISSLYGARRSVNDGPYNSYHEGTDFSAYRGSQVTAPAAGRVLLAEALAIRGGAVIIDHGLGLHSGYYHLSQIHVAPGQFVAAGDLLGEVGSTGRSTGNHLHWDLLVGRTWIDPLSWLEQDLDAWLSPAPPPSDEQPDPIR